MSDKQEQQVPYLTLGSRLKRLREQLQESVAEVAGAVEIDTKDLESFEKGQSRPTEDILDLLISHFSLEDGEEADKLWKLAGYDTPKELITEVDSPDAAPTIAVVPMDVRITYTDLSLVVANKHGVVVNFMQANGNGTKEKPMIISRVGMSQEQAEELIVQLRTELDGLKPKQLPPSTS